MDNKAVEKTVAIINQAQADIKESLKDLPDLYLRANNVLQTLSNSLSNAVGLLGIHGAGIEAYIGEPVENINGIPVSISKADPTKEVKPLLSDIEKLRADASELYKVFPGMTDEDIMLENHLVVRGVAKMAGLTVTADSPAMNAEFIADIKQAIEKKNEQDETVSKIKEATADANKEIADAKDDSAKSDFKKATDATTKLSTDPAAKVADETAKEVKENKTAEAEKVKGKEGATKSSK